MAKRLRCWTGGAGPALDRAVEDGLVSLNDAAEIRRFAEFLTKAGPPPRPSETLSEHMPKD
jgi:hypothetical protein